MRQSLTVLFGFVLASAALVPTFASETTKKNKPAILPSYRVEPPDILHLELRKADGRSIDDTITGNYLVDSDRGAINLGKYGIVKVAGHTTAEIKRTLEKHLATWFAGATILVDVRQINSQAVYVITQGNTGDNVLRIPFSSDQTVLDALHAAQISPKTPDVLLWIKRPSPKVPGLEETLSVDLVAIARGDRSTNYDLMPGDRIFVERLPGRAADRPSQPGDGYGRA